MKSIFTFLVLLIFCTESYAADNARKTAINPDNAYTYSNRLVNFDTKPYQADLNAVNDYFKHFTTMQARFTQTTAGDSAASISHGMVYLKRPGKSRWEYASPTPSLLFINNDRLTFYDIELQQVTYNDVPATPLKMLLDTNFDLFSKEIRILNVKKTNSTLAVNLTKSENIKNNTLGYSGITLIFGRNPLSLYRVLAADENNHTTTIEFQNPTFDLKLDDGLFIFKDQRPKKRK